MARLTPFPPMVQVSTSTINYLNICHFILVEHCPKAMCKNGSDHVTKKTIVVKYGL